MTSFAYDEGLDLAHDLLKHGIPVIVCPPVADWAPGSPAGDLRHPSGWATITAEECDLTAYRPGLDALAMVGGHGVDVVDVDTKDGGTVDNLPPFRHFGVHRTPSGGEHYLVRSTGIGKLSPLTTSAGHVGDYVGGAVGGGRRMLAYLPGSTRQKYPGATYTIEKRVDLDELLEHRPDDDLVGALEHLGGSREGLPGNRPVKRAEVTGFLADNSTLPASPCHYGRAAVAGELAAAAGTVPGDKVRGRHGWTVRATTRVVELVRAGCATSADLDAVEAKLHEIKPEGGTDFGGVLAWAIANADGSTGCGLHNPAAGGDPGPRLAVAGSTPAQPLRHIH